jgi:hypothetical protein
LSAELPADDLLQPLIAGRRAELQKAARKLGARVYEDSPKTFRRRCESACAQ